MGTTKLKKVNVVFEFLSLGSPRAVVVDFSVAIFALGIIPTAFLGQPGGICIWHRFVLPWVFQGYCPESGFFAHCFCPGCGMTHAVSRLLHGDFVGAYSYNHLVFLLTVVILIIYITNIIKLLKNRSQSPRAV